jgi:hypothetical protein
MLASRSARSQRNVGQPEVWHRKSSRFDVAYTAAALHFDLARRPAVRKARKRADRWAVMTVSETAPNRDRVPKLTPSLARLRGGQKPALCEMRALRA